MMINQYFLDVRGQDYTPQGVGNDVAPVDRDGHVDQWLFENRADEQI